MAHSEPTRRDFHRLAGAALGGLALGAAGCASSGGTAMAADGGPDELLKEPHVCCGLNTCKGIGVDKKNDCAGMGNCATAKKHTCKGENDCKGQGGCGENPGENACKGKGECAVPLTEDKWKIARTNFEAAMKKAGKKFGDPPKDCPHKA